VENLEQHYQTTNKETNENQTVQKCKVHETDRAHSTASYADVRAIAPSILHHVCDWHLHYSWCKGYCAKRTIRKEQYLPVSWCISWSMNPLLSIAKAC